MGKLTKENICGSYSVEVIRDGDFFIATAKNNGEEKWSLVTQGRDEDELFDMLSDAFKCVFSVKIPWYRLSVANIIRNFFFNIWIYWRI